ncbi:cysteine-rich CWC family protein [Vibrio mangrovi]|uniref:Cysteine-rich CWC family protein n=1 Tax=Vibrio mangrovi TaxID=474394 RepID=A0A1Y6INI8_9VIBR|nr:cysteine-rich CWC family protein [Vibrio mangrovi]MDW6003980.1 cysteine-rich CWC family protein [Vibrio mangrovi]SMR99224.1 hypothetical protein VIM7927_00448 [Vibrio mangrovi]
MSQNIKQINPLVCPLCGQPNACLNLSTRDVTKSCWCNDPNIRFPEGLRAMVPPEAKMKACICKACALKYQESQEKN